MCNGEVVLHQAGKSFLIAGCQGTCEEILILCSRHRSSAAATAKKMRNHGNIAWHFWTISVLRSVLKNGRNYPHAFQ